MEVEEGDSAGGRRGREELGCRGQGVREPGEEGALEA